MSRDDKGLRFEARQSHHVSFTSFLIIRSTPMRCLIWCGFPSRHHHHHHHWAAVYMALCPNVGFACAPTTPPPRTGMLANCGNEGHLEGAPQQQGGFRPLTPQHFLSAGRGLQRGEMHAGMPRSAICCSPNTSLAPTFPGNCRH